MARPRSSSPEQQPPKKKRPKRGSARVVEQMIGGAAPALTKTPPSTVTPGPERLDDRRGDSASVCEAALSKKSRFISLVHGLLMEPELLSDTMVTAPPITLLTYILRLAHASAGEAGIFGSCAVKRLHSAAQGRVEEASAARGVTSGVNMEKAAKIDNVIASKADMYVRILWWVHSILPEKLGGVAQEASAEAMRAVSLSPSDGDKLTAALDAQAEFLAKTGFKIPAKMTYSALRKVLNKPAVHDRAVSRVEQILSSSPFKERLAATMKNIGKTYLEPKVAAP